MAGQVAVYSSFNPRSRMGSDVWGGENVCTMDCFNPRSRMGSDQGKRS